ncbi:MAG TPA: 1-acyl-sn-glycerol-3-phosphate acyltransferase, partial [Nannocystaceae bacterium]|nr:1-acyl-sn-glycerol-3-phosphate acyltransferase [Nannocystaceae bacterium]
MAGSSRGFARALARIWFRSLQREGDEPRTGATLFVLNHPNGLVDALVPAALLDRPPRFLAKATLWKIPILKPLLAVFDPIPVHRRKDGDVGPDATAQTFAAVHEAFARGEAVAMFPEGISHAMTELAPLKTGAARIVLSSAVPVELVPAGLVYGERETFRHSVLLRIGTPIDYRDLAHHGAEPGAVRALTERIRAALVSSTLHGPDDEVQHLAERLAWLLAEGPAQRVQLEALRARVHLLAEKLRALAPEVRADIERRVARATTTLADAGIRADQVGNVYTRDVVARWLPGFLVRLALAPFILSIGALFWPPYRLTGAVIDRLALERDVQATYKFLLGLVLLPLWLVALVVLAAWRLGAAGVLAVAAAAAVAFIALPL